MNFKRKYRNLKALELEKFGFVVKNNMKKGTNRLTIIYLFQLKFKEMFASNRKRLTVFPRISAPGAF